MTRDELQKQYEVLADRADWLKDWGGSGAMSPYIRDAMMAALNLTAHALEQLDRTEQVRTCSKGRKQAGKRSQGPNKRLATRQKRRKYGG